MSTTLKPQFCRQPISSNFSVLTLRPKVVLMQLNRSPIQGERSQFQFNLFHCFRHEFICFLSFSLNQVPLSLEQYHFDVISIPSEALQTNSHRGGWISRKSLQTMVTVWSLMAKLTIVSLPLQGKTKNSNKLQALLQRQHFLVQIGSVSLILR